MKKVKNDKNERLHGQELIDAIMEDEIVIKPATEEQIIAFNQEIDKMNQKQERKDQIGMFFKPIFYTPLSILFHVLNFAFTVAGKILSITMIYGIYCFYKTFVSWKAGEMFIEDLKTAVILIILPFIAFTFAAITEKLWIYFDDNRY